MSGDKNEDVYDVIVCDGTGFETRILKGLPKAEAEARVEELTKPPQSAFYQRSKK